jgi:uncharacterized repeat protein (TIGR03837 family)
MQWDIFCRVIDNHGDIGVCWRLAADLGGRGEAVRLWVDDPGALDWMAPQGHPGVQVHRWAGPATAEPGDVVIEAFGCELDDTFQAAIADRARRTGRQPAWVNLEYLSAEGWVERCHGLPSPVSAGPAAGLAKRFFYPGFTARTGGLLREPDLLARQACFDRDAWLRRHGIASAGERLVSLFCYEPPGLGDLLQGLAGASQPTRLLVTAGRAAAAVRRLLDAGQDIGALTVHWLPLMTQPEFDQLLWACDFNFVRGEDSVVRALWAGRPFAWNIYPQDDGVHLDKLDAFLAWFQAPDSLRRLHAAWNRPGQPWPGLSIEAWQGPARQARDRALALPDLTSSLLHFVRD